MIKGGGQGGLKNAKIPDPKYLLLVAPLSTYVINFNQ